MNATYVWAVVLGMAGVNIVLRGVPIAVLSRLRLPEPAERWLGFVPVAVMASLVTGEVLRPGDRWLAPLGNPYLFAALPTALVYWRTRSLMVATLAGIALFLAFRALLG